MLLDRRKPFYEQRNSLSETKDTHKKNGPPKQTVLKIR